MVHCLREEKRTNGTRGERKSEEKEKEEERVQSDCLKDRLKHPPKTVSKRFSPTIWRKLDGDDSKVRDQGVWYAKGKREFAVTKERKPRTSRYACTRACTCVCLCAREYIRRRRRENERDLKRERARGRLFHLSPADAAFLSVIVPLTRPAATPFPRRPPLIITTIELG